MKKPLSQDALDTLFMDARTVNGWTDQSVDTALLTKIWDIARMGPTSANCSPARIVFVTSTAGKERLKPAAYLMLATRAQGLDCGPMSGFDKAKVDAEFFANTDVKSNFLCNIGYGTEEGLFPRSPRLAFAEACSVA